MDVERLRELERYEADASELFEHRTDVRKVGRVVAPPEADAARHVCSYGYGADVEAPRLVQRRVDVPRIRRQRARPTAPHFARRAGRARRFGGHVAREEVRDLRGDDR